MNEKNRNIAEFFREKKTFKLTRFDKLVNKPVNKRQRWALLKDVSSDRDRFKDDQNAAAGSRSSQESLVAVPWNSPQILHHP